MTPKETGRQATTWRDLSATLLRIFIKPIFSQRSLHWQNSHNLKPHERKIIMKPLKPFLEGTRSS